MKSPYIDLLKYGAENSEKKLSFFDAIKYLESKGYVFDKYQKATLSNWFFRIYDTPASVNLEHLYDPELFNDHIDKGSSHYGNLCEQAVFNSTGLMEYIEYIELKEAREAANKAQINAKSALIISIVTLVLSIIFSSIGTLFSAFQIIIDFFK